MKRYSVLLCVAVVCIVSIGCNKSNKSERGGTGDPNGPDGEVLLDTEVAGSIASGAALAVYFAPNTDRGFLDAITTALAPIRRCRMPTELRPVCVARPRGPPKGVTCLSRAKEFPARSRR